MIHVSIWTSKLDEWLSNDAYGWSCMVPEDAMMSDLEVTCSGTITRGSMWTYKGLT